MPPTGIIFQPYLLYPCYLWTLEDYSYNYYSHYGRIYVLQLSARSPPASNAMCLVSKVDMLDKVDFIGAIYQA